jgi:predicted dehydrogenase/threonine dehydrogenase-like Zn-dependent dehydrogenase
MLAVLADLKSGDVGTFDIPLPELRTGGVLVRTAFSAISVGTERTILDTGKKSLLGKALARPDLTRQVLDFAKTNGVRAAYRKVRSRLDTFSALGYSCSGTVLAVGDELGDFRPGDRVACAGAGYALHSEIDFVPRNLVARIPDAVSLEAASLTTIGAIAVQALRQASLSFGETVVIIGAGLLGVLSVQLARAAGCRVIAVDANPERTKQASNFGAGLVLTASDPSLSSKVYEFTRHGPDVALITATSNSAEPIELAARLLRDRGRVVVLGTVPIDLPREVMYRKELSLTLSRSYGPGRYDPSYEESGNDYPIGYVRWTEQRNMEAFLEFLSTGAVNVDALLQKRYAIENAGQAYSDLRDARAYTAILTYGSSCSAAPAPVRNAAHSRPCSGEVRIGCIGAGSFARSVIFPELRALPGVHLEAVGTASGASAFSARKTFSFRRAQPPATVLSDPDVDAVFVLSHHDSHAAYVVSALSNQKPVFVEKPLAVCSEQLESVRIAYQAELDQGRSPFVMAGFNRRFSPAFGKIRDFFAGRREPMVIHIRVNAGCLPREHWTQREANGGRIVGEACHFLDWVRAMVGGNITSVYASATPSGARYNQDNVAITASFDDGSVGNILYLANGDKSVAKEFYEVFCEGAVAQLDDYRTLTLVRNGKRRRTKCDPNKGHRNEIALTLAAIREGTPSPIPFEELVQVTESTFAAVDSLKCGLPVRLRSAPAPIDLNTVVCDVQEAENV